MDFRAPSQLLASLARDSETYRPEISRERGTCDHQERRAGTICRATWPKFPGDLFPASTASRRVATEPGCAEKRRRRRVRDLACAPARRTNRRETGGERLTHRHGGEVYDSAMHVLLDDRNRPSAPGAHLGCVRSGRRGRNRDGARSTSPRRFNTSGSDSATWATVDREERNDAPRFRPDDDRSDDREELFEALDA